MKNEKLVIENTERIVKTYSEMWHTSDVLFESGQMNPKGSIHLFRASLVFTACVCRMLMTTETGTNLPAKPVLSYH